MTELAPHGGCNWSGCQVCFPQQPKTEGNTMNPYDMLCKVIKFNREMMASADFTQYAEGTPEFEMTYQIYLDAEKAFSDAKRMITYGVGDLDAPKPS